MGAPAPVRKGSEGVGPERLLSVMNPVAVGVGSRGTQERSWAAGPAQGTCAGQSTSCGDVQSSWGGGAGKWDRSGCAQGAPRSANGQGEEQHSHTECGSHTKRDGGECSRQRGGGQRGRGGNQNTGNREPERRRWESMRMGGSDNKGDGLASQPLATGCQGNPCSTGIRGGGGGAPAAQMGCLRSRRGCPPGADQPRGGKGRQGW